MKKNILGYCLLLVAVLLASCSKKNNYTRVRDKFCSKERELV